MTNFYLNAVILAQGWYYNASEQSKPMYLRLLQNALENYEKHQKGEL